MGRKRKERRQPHGAAWHWKQTDCWYYTMPGTKKRMPLFDENGERIRGLENKAAAVLALSQVKVAGDGHDNSNRPHQKWLVGHVCSEYLEYCERSFARGTMSQSHRDGSFSFLKDLCRSCGALAVAKLKKGHVQHWLESHATWRSPATHRSAIAIVVAAFNRAEEMFGVVNPLKGLKRPVSQPRLQSINPEDEQTLYQTVEPRFGDFLFAAIHTGLRPYCELAKLTADDVEEFERGMMWRVYSSKTKKTRKIPVRPEVAELTRKLMKSAPRGSGLPLFRNTKGQPWKRMTGVVRFLSLKRKLHWDEDPVRKKYSSYACRHTFAHRMLSGYWTNGVGCSIETLAELLGDTPKVAFDHYGKEWGQHYQDPLWAAIGTSATPSVEANQQATSSKPTRGSKPAPAKQKRASRKTAGSRK